MASERKAVRQAVVNLISANISLGASKVFSTRVVPVHAEELPVVMVYALSEHAEVYNVAPVTLKRHLSLAVEIIAQASATVEDTLDNLAWEVEDILRSDQTLGNTVSDFTYKSTDISISENGEQLVGGLRLAYDCVYYTDELPSTGTIDDFVTADAVWLPNGATDDSPAAEDIVHPEQ